MINPVIDLWGHAMSSDIPDWCFSVSINQDITYKHEDIDQLRYESPINFTLQITVPSLFLLGQDDKRVVPFQSIHMHKALKSQGTKTSLKLYPEESHEFTKPEQTIDSMVSTLDWIEQHF